MCEVKVIFERITRMDFLKDQSIIAWVDYTSAMSLNIIRTPSHAALDVTPYYKGVDEYKRPKYYSCCDICVGKL